MEWNFSKSPVNDSDFRWNWAKANVDPSYKPQGPGIGSLLMSLNPNTQQQGLQQINDDMSRDTAARDAVLKQGAAENKIIDELYNQDMDMKKLAETMQGRVNADNRNILDAEKQYAAAPDEGTRQFWASRIKLLDPQNAESRIANLEGMRVETQKQNKLGKETLAKFSGRFNTPGEQADAIKEVTKLYEDGDENGVKLTLDDYAKIVQSINGKLDLSTERNITAGNMKSNDRTQKQIKKSDADILAELEKKAPADYLSNSSRKNWARDEFIKIYGYAPEGK